MLGESYCIEHVVVALHQSHNQSVATHCVTTKAMRGQGKGLFLDVAEAWRSGKVYLPRVSFEASNKE